MPNNFKFVKMKTFKELVRNKIIEIDHLSDDGEHVRYKILPNGPVVSEWCNFGEKLMVVDCEVVHKNFVEAYSQLFEEIV